MTALQDPQLDSSWTAELLKSRALGGSSFLYKYEGLSLRWLSKLSYCYCNFGAQFSFVPFCKPIWHDIRLYIKKAVCDLVLSFLRRL